MGASSGWNLVARRPSRARVAAKKPARHLASVPCGPSAVTERGADARDGTVAPRVVRPARGVRLTPARVQASRFSRYAASRVSGNEIRKKTTMTKPKISTAWISPMPAGGKTSAARSALAGLKQLGAADHRRERRVLDDVDEQADERRQEAAQGLREDDEHVPADPAEAERRGRLVLLARDRPDGAARRLGDLGAAPEDRARSRWP